MSKHIIDRPRSAGTARAERFAKIEAGRQPSPQAKTLQRRPLNTDAQARARRFLEIARRGATG